MGVQSHTDRRRWRPGPRAWPSLGGSRGRRETAALRGPRDLGVWSGARPARELPALGWHGEATRGSSCVTILIHETQGERCSQVSGRGRPLLSSRAGARGPPSWGGRRGAAVTVASAAPPVQARTRLCSDPTFQRAPGGPRGGGCPRLKTALRDGCVPVSGTSPVSCGRGRAEKGQCPWQGLCPYALAGVHA